MRPKKTSGIRLLVLTALLLSSLGVLEGQFAGGRGTEADPWQVATAQHLSWVRNYLGNNHRDKHFIQTADIDLGVAPWNTDTGWVPIGSVTNNFTGTYDGNGYTISNLTIDNDNLYHAGLFGQTTKVLKNITLDNVNIRSRGYIGGLVARSVSGNALIINCHVSGIIKGIGGEQYIGGLVGNNYDNAQIHNSSSRVLVDGSESTSSYTRIGGLVGSNECGLIRNCYSLGDVRGNQVYPERTGGFVGLSVTVNGIFNCYSRSNVTNGAGFAGQNSGTLLHCYSTGTASAGQGFIGLLGVSTNCYWDTESSQVDNSPSGEGRNTEQMTYHYADNTYVDWDFDVVWVADTTDLVNDGYPFLSWQQRPFPLSASNPQPYDGATAVSTSLDSLSWSYRKSSLYTTPIGFKVYFSNTDEFDEEEYLWVDYVEEKQHYAVSEILPAEFAFNKTYYWKVVPTTELSRQRNDSPFVSVWSFSTELNPTPIAAFSPLPEDGAEDISVELARFSWIFETDPDFIDPLGFRLCFGTNPENLVVHGLFVLYEDVEEHYSLRRDQNQPLSYSTTYYWKVVPTTREEGVGEGYDAQNVPVWSFTTEANPTSVEIIDPQLITSLHGNYPNPFNPETAIRFSIKEDSEAILHIYNLKGQLVKSLWDGAIRTGNHSLIWNGRDESGNEVGSGVYFYRLKTEDYDQVNKMLLVK